jgi:broad specificity phosphatase PhoE
MKIYLIRHGQTTGDLEDRYGGSYDDHLTELGKNQLRETADRLVGCGIEIIFSSPLIRAKESAEIISSKIGCPIEGTEGLKERHYGILTGLTKPEALERYPDTVESHKNPKNTDPKGESYVDFQIRVIKSFNEIKEKDFKTIAIVSHGGPIKQILSYLKMPVPEKLEDGQIIEIEL